MIIRNLFHSVRFGMHVTILGMELIDPSSQYNKHHMHLPNTTLNSVKFNSCANLTPLRLSKLSHMHNIL